MDLSGLIFIIAKMPAYRCLVEELGKRNEHRVTLLDAAKPYLIAALHQELRLPLMVVAAYPERAKKIYEQLQCWCPNDTPILLFPEPDALPYEPLPSDPFIEQQRLQVLSRLNETRQKPESEPPLIIASAAAVTRKTIPYTGFVSSCHTLTPGMRINPLELLARWGEMGYEVENAVEVPGKVSRRGGILDIYPPSSELPLRLEFFGNEIESIRGFDPHSQRSLKPVWSANIVPAREALCSQGTIFEYLPKSTLLILDEPSDIEAAVEELDTQASELQWDQIEKGKLQEDSPLPYLTWLELEANLTSVESRLSLRKWSTSDGLGLDFSSAPSYGGRLPLFLEQAKLMLQEGYCLVIVSHQAHRLSELLREQDIFVSPLSCIEQLPPPGTLTLGGWKVAEVVLLTDVELFGFTKQQRMIKKRPISRGDYLSELSPGDYAVHIDHGIARFSGMVKMFVDQVEREYLVLEYAAGDRLYVPTDQADHVTRYIGSRGELPSLSRLGSQEWARTKQRVKESAREIAKGLLNLYAAREIAPGFAFSSDTLWQQELEISFPYVETPDQVEAVGQVKEDMERSKPMDRLVCGDVGYGKTEVALRAAFKAVLDGKQVAILVPTTVLAQQHFTTFNQRLGAFPVKVEMLSRFRSEKEQQPIIEGLADGTIDICIGTHRLLQKDVSFKDLGLVIIDEEQRFGVAHKERLKQVRKEVDVLTLSATPIPRTLHMSLVGVRDMSTMETPPEERLPIKTYVAEYDELLIREAIIRELERNGQAFFIHNRVQSIYQVAHRLRGLIPEAEIAIAHGQMPEKELETAMLNFVQGEVDVLVCTTIIESGLDIPNVNTLIVNEADKLGLAQLYQLRGRVGRGTNRAYAYFLYGKGKRLTPAAEKRLQTIFEATELGAGFRIAMKDLEIRGAGNLLGAEQSGHIAAIGFDLYCQLLAEAVEELKEKPKEVPITPSGFPSPAIDLPLSAYIPQGYVADLSTRLALYNRLARVRSPEEVEQLAGEFKDRFGLLPSSVENLLYMVKLKALGSQAGVESISREDRQIVIKLREGVKIRSKELEGFQPIKTGATQLRLDMKQPGSSWQETLEEGLRRLKSIGGVR